VVNQSNDPAHDALTGANCGTNPARIAGGYQDRCGYGPRLPLLVVSPYARQNFVDHSVTDQTSILKFVEDNWKTGPIGNYSFDEKAGSLGSLFDFHHKAKALYLDPVSGQPVKH